MTESKPGARPSQVTMAGWLAATASGLLVLSLFDAMSQLRSIEMRESITEFLANPPGSGLGLDVPQVVEILRVLTLFSGAAAAAALVLAIYVLQRNNAARIGFTIVAAVIMVTSPVAGGFLPVVIAFAAVMLWTRPARDWFAGRAPGRPEQGMSSEPPPPPERPTSPPAWPRMPESEDRPTPPPSEGWPPPSSGEQPPSAPYGQPPSGQPAPYPYQQQYGAPPYAYGGYPAHSPADERPTTVAVAAWLTWIFAGLTGLVYLLLAVLLLAAGDQLLEALQREPQLQQLDISTNDLMGLLWVMCAIFLFWCAAAVALAVLAFRRVNWARITLAVSAGISALLSVAAFPAGILHMLAAGATAVLLFVGGANEWYARRSPSGYPPYGQPPYGQQGQPPYGPSYGAPADRPSHEEQEPPKNVW